MPIKLPLLDSLLGSIVYLIYDHGMESMRVYWIPPTLGRLDNFHRHFNKT